MDMEIKLMKEVENSDTYPQVKEAQRKPSSINTRTNKQTYAYHT